MPSQAGACNKYIHVPETIIFSCIDLWQNLHVSPRQKTNKKNSIKNTDVSEFWSQVRLGHLFLVSYSSVPKRTGLRNRTRHCLWMGRCARAPGGQTYTNEILMVHAKSHQLFCSYKSMLSEQFIILWYSWNANKGLYIFVSWLQEKWFGHRQREMAKPYTLRPPM